MKRAFMTRLLLLPLVACASAQDHRADVSNQDKDRLTVVAAQRELHRGMTSAGVVEVLGSPNMVTTDENRRESWGYDKISTKKIYSTSSVALGLFLVMRAQQMRGTAWRIWWRHERRFGRVQHDPVEAEHYREIRRSGQSA